MPDRPLEPQDAEELAWGCLFCSTGRETVVISQITDIPEVREAFVVRQAQHRSVKGLRSQILKVIMPGYVFFRAERGLDTYPMLRNGNVIRLLRTGDDWRLRGDDLRFAEWVGKHGGMLGMSRAYHEGERVVIASGPLKEMEGVIQKVDRHNRNGLIIIRFGGKETKVWLPFEYISEDDS